ncbi:hypothetical protein BFP72_05655 [Reichenbachiella sp. 5M10]|uniref:hypothetical protein n=1 Tax=Reichenbachiella sp. 5M10 TaxID=1889772 RepID=UPI000C147122|nr:hypothetical protein [Reichenbachiella sp. 5M10]PIB34915.1 hypothetical protein BFP72_05655 [Reichenbachiella sp. 5M10]
MNNKTYKIGFFVLLVINITWVSLFLFRPKPPQRQNDIKDKISEELNLNEDQKRIYDGMAMQHRHTLRGIDLQERELIKAFFNQLLTNGTTAKENVQLDKILQLEEEKIMVTYRHFEELKGLCDEKQSLHFDSVLKSILPLLLEDDQQGKRPDKPPFRP